MAIHCLAPGAHLANLIRACETRCVHECCGIAAFNFSPLHVAAHLTRNTDSIEPKDVDNIRGEIDALLAAAVLLASTDPEFCCSVDGTNECLSLTALQTFARRLLRTIEVAPAVLALSDSLERAYDETLGANGN